MLEFRFGTHVDAPLSKQDILCTCIKHGRFLDAHHLLHVAHEDKIRCEIGKGFHCAYQYGYMVDRGYMISSKYCDCLFKYLLAETG